MESEVAAREIDTGIVGQPMGRDGVTRRLVLVGQDGFLRDGWLPSPVAKIEKGPIRANRPQVVNCR
jgi:hypothetical protein